MPIGTQAAYGDTVPGESPVGVAIPPDAVSVEFQAEGQVAHGPRQQHPYDPPGGSESTRHQGGAENGISDITAPMNSLLGVFLTNEQPNLTPATGELKLRRAGRDTLRVTPQLKQVFFIGTGKTSAGAQRSCFLVPKGATRLFLGVMDGYEWNNNEGEFRVVITLERTEVSSTLTFAEWACLPSRSQCTPGEAVVRELGQNRFHIILPAHLKWGASIPTFHGSDVKILEVTGTVCLEARTGSRCNGPAGDEKQTNADVLVKGRATGALITKTTGDRTYFSVNGPVGPAFEKQEGFFEFDVMVR